MASTNTAAQARPASKPKMVQANNSSMRLHRDFIRKMSWVEAMLGYTTGKEEWKKNAGGSIDEKGAILKRQSSPVIHTSTLLHSTSPTSKSTFEIKRLDDSEVQKQASLAHSQSESDLLDQTSTVLHRKNKYTLELDHYNDFKKDQEFFQKKLVQSKPLNTATLTPTTLAKEKERAQELKSLENLAREQSDVVVCFLAEVLFHLISSSTSNKTTQPQPPPKPTQQQNAGKSFLSLENLKSFIFNSLKKNTSSNSNAKSTTTTSISEPNTEQTSKVAQDAKSEEAKAEIKQFLQKLISRIPVDPRLHVVALMYFDKFIHVANVPSLKAANSGKSLSRLSMLRHTRSKSSDDLPISSILAKHSVSLENYHKYYAMCIVLASKMWEDRFYSNLSYFELFGLPSAIDFASFNETEGVILDSLKFELHITYDAFRDFIEHYSTILHSSIYKSLNLNCV